MPLMIAISTIYSGHAGVVLPHVIPFFRLIRRVVGYVASAKKDNKQQHNKRI